MGSWEKMPPLTVNEQKMAEDNYHLIDEFLRRKHLDPNSYFDTVVFGYLQAIQYECRNPNPPENKNFHGLVEVCMKRAVLQEWRYQRLNKRRGDLEGLSLDCMSSGDTEFSLYDVVADVRQNTGNQVEDRDLVERILSVATPREREAIGLVCTGFEPHEIADILGIRHNTAYRILCNFRAKAKAVRADREVIRSPAWVRNKEKIQAKNRAYQQAHRQELNAKAAIWKRAYRAAHPEKVRAKERAYRAAKRAAKKAQEKEPSSVVQTPRTANNGSCLSKTLPCSV